MNEIFGKSLSEIFIEEYWDEIMKSTLKSLKDENERLKEYNENLIRADKKKTEYIEQLEKENKELKEYKFMYEDLCD